MRPLSVAVVTSLLLLNAVSADTLELPVTSDPPGAEVSASPADHPGLYLKGVTPCTITLQRAGAPHRLVLRAPGYFEAFHTVQGDGPVHVEMVSRRDPANWRSVPALWDTIWWVAQDAEPRAIHGLPPLMHRSVAWSPDATGILYSGSTWGSAVEEMGLAKPDDDRNLSDLWYAPLHGPPVRLWRFISEPRALRYFMVNAQFSPDARWVVHSAPVGRREHLELLRLDTGARKTLARDDDATLYRPVFSPDARWIACIREAREQDDDYDMDLRMPPPSNSAAHIQVMRWNGADRRTVVEAVHAWHTPAFSPDGRELAFITEDAAVAVVPVTGGEARVVLDPPGWTARSAPRWSPDGRTIAADFGPFARHAPADLRRVVWARLDGSASGAIPAVSLHAWHDDVSLEVYAEGVLPPANAPYRRLLWVGLDGELKAVLHEHPAGFRSVAFSPDDTRGAALENGPGGRQSLVLARRGEETIRRITAPEFAEATAVGWLDDESVWVSVADDGTGPPGYRVDVADGALTPLTEAPAPAPRPRPLDPWDDIGGLPPVHTEEHAPFPVVWSVLAWGNLYDSLAPTIPAGGDGR